MLKRSFAVWAAAFTIFMVAFMIAAPAAKANDVEEQAERAREAARVFDEILAAPDDGIPEDLLAKAEAIAVIPHVVKGAFIVGGQYGKGLVAHRHDDGVWSAPAYVDLGGASIGLQIGASATDYILVFTNSEGLEPLLKGKVELGGNASVAAGPVGRSAKAATDVTLNAAIFSYSRSKGVFAGVSLDGAAITMDDSANEKVYGGKYTGRDILLDHKVSVNSTVQPFVTALRKHTSSSDN